MKSLLTSIVFIFSTSFVSADVKSESNPNLLRCVTMSKKALDSKNGTMREVITSDSKGFYNFTINLETSEIVGLNVSPKDVIKNTVLKEMTAGSFFRSINIYTNSTVIYLQIQRGLFPKDAPYAFIGMLYDDSFSGVCFDSKKSM